MIVFGLFLVHRAILFSRFARLLRGIFSLGKYNTDIYL